MLLNLDVGEKVFNVKLVVLSILVSTVLAALVDVFLLTMQR